MESKKLKLLYNGRKGILLNTLPESLDCLFSTIEKYLCIDSSKLQITFKDTEKDECEILDNDTYQAACSEFTSKVILTVTAFNSVPISRINPLKLPKNREILTYLKKNSRKMAIFDIQLETVQWITFQPGVLFKEFAAWVKLPTGEIFCCGGGHPLSSAECFLLNPYTQTYKKMPDMLTPRHSHGILYKDGFVYVFGGMSNMMFLGNFIKDCEKFSLLTHTWQHLPQLQVAVADSAAASWNDQIFVVGKGCSSIMNIHNHTFFADLSEDGGACMVVEGTDLFIFRGSKVSKIDLEKRKIVEEVKLAQKQSWWSHCPPVVFNGFIYFVWWEEPGWVCKWDCTNKSLIKLVNLFI